MPLLVRPYLSLCRGASIHTGPVVQSSLACHAFSGEIELIGMGTPNQGTGLVEITTNPDFSRISVVELK